MIREIEINAIHPHPENPNWMPPEIFEKLYLHIERSGRYEPLVVRPHPKVADAFELINGHHRLQALRRMAMKKAQCVVWEIDDSQARLNLDSLNRICGQDIPELRTSLLEGLLQDYSADELARLVPDNIKELGNLEHLVNTNLENLTDEKHVSQEIDHMQFIAFSLCQTDAEIVNLALARAEELTHESISHGESLVAIARFYLEQDH